LGHEHKFITEIVARRANDCIVSITEPDFKNLNKNDIEDIYFLIMNGKIPDYADTRLLWSLSVFIRSSVTWERVHDFQLGIESYQHKVNLTIPTINFPGIEEHDMFSIIYEPVHGIIYKNSKKEKRVMRHTEIHKFCDATLNRELEEEIEASKAYEKMGDSQEIPTLAAFQTNDLDAFDSDCDEAPYASVVLIAKLSSYDPETLSEVPTHENYLDNHVIDQTVQGIQYSEQPVFDNDTDIENDITSESNMISYEQYLNETKYVVVQYTSSSVQHKSVIMFIIEEMSNQVAKCNKKDNNLI
ncbi:hypothetical protein Tco_1528953, partial [Tanacetum coccineum]